MKYELISYFGSILPPEFLHKMFITSLKLNFFKKIKKFENLKFKLLGKEFDNPLGLAAGFDKNAEVIGGSLNLGFGFVELGTVTPMPQNGNLKPRVFKIPEYDAVIQRLGFNNCGIEIFLRNLKEYKKKNNSGIIGVNIGKNKGSKDLFSDYELLFELVQPYVDYITINVSSPNTPGLRDLQKKGTIEKLLKRLMKLTTKLPIFIKISPDILLEDLDNICKIALKEKFLSGLILTNTTTSRDSLFSKQIKNSWKINEDGGLSGPPLRNLTNSIIRRVYRLTNGKIIIIGVGGISSGRDAFEKISLGCNLIQLYTSLIYKGPNVVLEILGELSNLIKINGYKNITELVGKKIDYGNS